MKKQKIYEEFKDKFGNVYKFENYLEFSIFWFNMNRKTAQNHFPDNFQTLQNVAANSKEARQKT